MRYLLDTNACIAIIKGIPESVRQRFDKEVKSGAELFVSSIVVFELWYGLGKSVQRQSSERFMERFLMGFVRILPFDQDDARAAGLEQARLELRGLPIGAYDLLIAGQAMQRGLTLVTANRREFQRIDGLNIESWVSS